MFLPVLYVVVMLIMSSIINYCTGQKLYTRKWFEVNIKRTEILQTESFKLFKLVWNRMHPIKTTHVHTRFKTNLHPPIANLTKFQKGVYYRGIKIFSNLPHNIKDLANETKLFRNALKRFLLSNSFFIIVKNILIIRDNMVKTGRKLKAYYFY